MIDFAQRNMDVTWNGRIMYYHVADQSIDQEVIYPNKLFVPISHRRTLDGGGEMNCCIAFHLVEYRHRLI